MRVLSDVCVEASGVESIIHFSPERTFIGDITSAVTGQPTLYAVDAIEPSTTLTIDLASFNRMLERFRHRARLLLGCGGPQGAQQRRIACR